MFDIGWSEFLIFAVVTLIFVGPKDLPVFMRTIGRYVGVLRRHADEFRSYFDSAMKEAEIDQMRSDLESVREQVDQSLHSAKAAIDSGVSDVAEPSQPASQATRATVSNDPVSKARDATDTTDSEPREG